MKPKTIRRLFAIHRITGAVVAINLFLLSVTGMILVFGSEIDALFSGRIKSASSAAPRPLPELVAAAQQSRPTDRPVYVYFEEGKPELAYVGMAPPGTKDPSRITVVWLDARTARAARVTEGDEGGFLRFIYDLHAKLFLGEAGKLLVGLLGLALVLSIATGFIVYGPAIRRFWFGMLRTSGRLSLLAADLHKLVGAALSGWLLVVAVTGVLLGFGTVAQLIFQRTALAELTAPYRGHPPPERIAALDAVVAQAKRRFPQSELALLSWPGSDYSGDYHFGVFMRGRSGLERKLFKLAFVDAATGTLAAARELPWYLKAVFLSQPLHYGDYGGLPLKILWALFGLASAVLSATGFYVFVARRRGRRSGAAEVAEPLLAVREGAAAHAE